MILIQANDLKGFRVSIDINKEVNKAHGNGLYLLDDMLGNVAQFLDFTASF